MCYYLPLGNFLETEVTERNDDIIINAVFDTEDDQKMDVI